jgi:prepilin-type processing-associated H-X9-DG protein
LPDAELTIKSIYNDGVPAAVGDPYACLWICVLKGTVSPKSFICKADPGSPQAMQIADSSGRFYQDFAPAFTVPGGPPVASYGFAYPWAKQGTTPTFNVAGYWHNTADSSIPIASDAGSGTRSASAPSAKLGNSLNHNGEGQNVAFADAHVEFQKTPLVGQGGENIFDVYPTDTVTTFDRTPNYSSNRTPIDVVGKAGAWLTTMVPQRTAAAGSAW